MSESPEVPEHPACRARLEAVLAGARPLEAAPTAPLGIAFPLLLSPLLVLAARQAALAHGAATLGWLALGGWCQAGLAFVGHDAAHLAHTGRPGPDAWIGRLAFAHTFTSFHAFREMHRGHHLHAGFDEDPSGDSPALTRRANFLTHVLFILLPLGFPLFAILPGWLSLLGFQPAVYPAAIRPGVLGDLLATVALQLGLHALLGPRGYLMLVATFALGVSLVSLVLALSHAGAAQYVRCPRCNARTITTPWWMQAPVFFAGYHVEHHLLPRLPWYRMAAVHRLLMESGGPGYPSRGFVASHLEVLAGHLGLRPPPPAPLPEGP